MTFHSFDLVKTQGIWEFRGKYSLLGKMNKHKCSIPFCLERDIMKNKFYRRSKRHDGVVFLESLLALAVISFAVIYFYHGSLQFLMMSEQQLLWTPALEKAVVEYWRTLNGYWNNKKLPSCTCANHENGFMAGPKYNPYYYNGEPCSLEYLKKFPELIKAWRAM